MKPKELNICGVTYRIEYCDNPSDVDIHKREACWGQVDYWTQSIRVYDKGLNAESIWNTILHEILHVIGYSLKLDILDFGKGENEIKHNELDVLARTLVDTFIRNGLLVVRE